MMLCAATSLIKRNGFDAVDQMKRLVDWQRTGAFSSTGSVVGITPAVAKAIAAYKWSNNAFAGSHDPSRWDPEALSRTGAVVLYAAATPETLFSWVADLCRVTHQSPGILDACRYYAALLLAIVRGSPKSSLMGAASALLQAHYGKSLKAPVQRLAEMDAFPLGEPPANAEAAVGVLHRVLRVLSETTDFRDGLLKVCNLGGPADVQGALFGQLAGALYGIDSLPKRWRDAVLQRQLIEDIVEHLIQAAAAREE